MEKIKEKKDAMKVATGFIAGITAVKLATMSCLVFTVCVIVSILIIAFIAISKINGDKFTRRGIVTLVVAIITLVCVGCYHRYFCHNVVETPEVVAEETTTEEDTTGDSEQTAEETTVEESEETNSYKARPEMGYCPENERVSSETTNTRKNAEEQVQKETDEPAHFEGENNEAYQNKIDEAVEEAEKNGADVGSIDVEGKDVSTVVETKPQPEKEPEGEKAEINKDEAVEIENEDEKTSTNVESEEKVEEAEASDDKTLDDMLEESTTEITEDTTSETTEETTEVVTTPADGEVTVEEVNETDNSNNVVTDVEEPTEVKEPVVDEVAKIEVNAVDGYEGYINSTMQFSIEGDDVVLEGLDGIDYSFSNGILSVNTGDSATILTITASNSVSSQTFDVVINGIVG